MNMIHNVDFQQTVAPTWAEKVNRWYQLDEISYSFCEAIHHWNYFKEIPRPEIIILALDGASNTADYDFVQTNPSSPAKFVYTLPNIAASIIFQLIDYQGKVFCFHQGTNTLQFAKSEAAEFAKSGKSIWLFHSSPDPEPGKRKVYFANY